MPVYVEDETLVVEETAYSFKEALSAIGVTFTLDGTWMKSLYETLGMIAPDVEANEYYKALGIMLSDIHVAICKSLSLDVIKDRMLKILNKNDMIIEDYKAYETAITAEITALTSKSVTRFNDTPTEEGDFTADKYTSNISQTENSVEYDINTKINIAKRRLKHLKESYVNEFKGVIIWIN